MNKNKLIFWGIVVAVIIILLVVVHYFPLWVSLVNLVCIGLGCVIGWISKIVYNKYCKIKDVING